MKIRLIAAVMGLTLAGASTAGLAGAAPVAGPGRTLALRPGAVVGSTEAAGRGGAAAAGGAAADGPDWRKVPHSSTEATLRDVAAISGTDAWSVGDRQPPQENPVPLAEHWDGTSWTAVPVPPTPTGGGELDGIAATSTNDVWAVGDSSGLGPVIRHWNGTAWGVVPPAAPPGNDHPGADHLYDVTVAPTGQAWAVGLYSNWDNPGPVTLIESWDGTSWTRVPTPSPGRTGNSLQGASAISATDAWAVGWYTGDQANVALALHWDGHAWTQSPMSLPAGNTELQGVTAVAADDVWAVGTNEGRPLTMHWNGTRWNVLPSPPLTSVWLQTVAPASGDGVWAAGYQMTDDGTVSRPLFLHWDGSSWTTGTSEEPEGAVYGLAAVGPVHLGRGHDLTLLMLRRPTPGRGHAGRRRSRRSHYQSRAASMARWKVGKAYIICRRRSTGTSPWTATVSAPRISPPIGPADVPPTRRPSLSISLMKPSARCSQPRVLLARSVLYTRTSPYLLASLVFGEADGADLRVGEGDAGQGAVVGAGAVLAEDVSGGDAALVHRDVRERALPGDVADRPQAVAGAHPVVDLDGAGVRVQADRLEAEPAEVRTAPDGDE